MSADLIVAITGVVTGIIGAAIAISTIMQAAKRADVEALKETVKALQDENQRLRARVDELERENEELRKRLSNTKPKGAGGW